MLQFNVRCGKQKVEVKHMVADLLCVTYRGNNYLVRHCFEDGWLLTVGKMPTDTFVKICETIEAYILHEKAA